MPECYIILQPQDNIVRTLEIVPKEILIEGQYYAGDLPYKWKREVEEIYWAPSGNGYADHYKVLPDCSLVDYDTGEPGYHEAPGWRDSIVLRQVTQQTTTTTTQPEVTTTTQPPPSTTTTTTYVGIAGPVEELPFTGVDAGGLFTASMVLFGVGFLITAYVKRFKEGDGR